MKHTDPAALAALVAEAVGNSPAANDFDGADVSFGEFDDDNDFIRVLVHLRNLDKLSEDEADTLTAVIEGIVSEHDDRFASVRYAES